MRIARPATIPARYRAEPARSARSPKAAASRPPVVRPEHVARIARQFSILGQVAHSPVGRASRFMRPGLWQVRPIASATRTALEELARTSGALRLARAQTSPLSTLIAGLPISSGTAGAIIRGVLRGSTPLPYVLAPLQGIEEGEAIRDRHVLPAYERGRRRIEESTGTPRPSEGDGTALDCPYCSARGL